MIYLSCYAVVVTLLYISKLPLVRFTVSGTAKFIRVGNSIGIRLPKHIVGAHKIGTLVEITVKDKVIVMRPILK